MATIHRKLGHSRVSGPGGQSSTVYLEVPFPGRQADGPRVAIIETNIRPPGTLEYRANRATEIQFSIRKKLRMRSSFSLDQLPVRLQDSGRRHFRPADRNDSEGPDD